MQRTIAILAVVLAGALAAGGGAHAQDPFGGRDRFAQQQQPFGQPPPGNGRDPLGDMRGNFNAEQARGARQAGAVNIDSVQARAAALNQFPGAEYLDLELRGNPPAYHVVLKSPDGRRVNVIVDAQTGQVLGAN
jgi:hypothetical protein